jgi:hypothetical protein
MKQKKLNFNFPAKNHITSKRNIALVISSYQPNKYASELLRIALRSLEKFPRPDVSIWVVDVGSPKHAYLVTPSEFKDVNFISTDHTPIDYDAFPIWKRLLSKKKLRNGSYANGWTLEYALSIFDNLNYTPEYMMTLQMDIIVTHKDWLGSLLNLFDDNVIAVGVREQVCFDKSQKILHSLGCLWDYKKFKELDLDLMPDFPKYDVGERAIAVAVKSGKDIVSMRCSYNYDMTHILDKTTNSYIVDKTIDSHDNVVFLHFGRGIIKAKKNELPNKMTLNDWRGLYEKYCN